MDTFTHQPVEVNMYTPYSSSTPRNKSRLYLFLFLAFLALIIYWRYSSTKKPKRTFQSAGEEIDGAIEQGKNKFKQIKEKVDDTIEATKDKAKKAADQLENAAADVKKKL